MLYRVTELLIRSLKRDTSYSLDPNLAGWQLLQTLRYRGFSLIRGQWHRLWLGKSTSKLFVGTHVVLRYPQYISVGTSVIIEDFVTIDALSREGVILGDNVTVAKYATIQCTGVIRNIGAGLKIGDNSAIGAYSFIGAQGGVRIGENVIVGPRVNFHSENHRYDRFDAPIRTQGETRKGIIVGDDCWIGAGCIIVDGVQIGNGCVVAAGSVVTKDIPAFSVIAGVPAKVIKNRSQ
jgi:acetyltransferase-like isoleucine patch superfamily enzyme